MLQFFKIRIKYQRINGIYFQVLLLISYYNSRKKKYEKMICLSISVYRVN
jgi:hypothetical protein